MSIVSIVSTGIAHELHTKMGKAAQHLLMDRLRSIFKQGIRTQGFVIVHEAPLCLPAPSPQDKPKTNLDVLKQIGCADGSLYTVMRKRHRFFTTKYTQELNV